MTQLSLELAARMIFLGGMAPTLELARDLAQRKLLDGSGYRKLKQVIQAQGGNRKALDRFELLPNATGLREIVSPRARLCQRDQCGGYRPGMRSPRRGPRREGRTPSIRPWASILEVKVGQKVEASGVLCRIYYTSDEQLEEAAQAVEDAFRISNTVPEQRELILEVVG